MSEYQYYEFQTVDKPLNEKVDNTQSSPLSQSVFHELAAKGGAGRVTIEYKMLREVITC